MTMELELTLPDVALDLSLDALLDLAVPADDDFAFTTFHESDGEDSPRSVDTCLDTSKRLLTMADDHETVISFVEKTYYMVNTCGSHLVCWNATGMGFFILDTDAFAREVLPDYFKHFTMKSFVKELTLHGFRKTIRRHKTRAIECLEFRHPHFVRGDVTQLTKIQRIASVSASIAETVEYDHLEDQDDDMEEHMGDLKCEISKLKGEVQQTQNLFDKLLVTLMQQNATEATQKTFPMPVYPSMGFPPMVGIPPPTACLLPMAYDTSVPAQTASESILEEPDFFSELFPDLDERV